MQKPTLATIIMEAEELSGMKFQEVLDLTREVLEMKGPSEGAYEEFMLTILTGLNELIAGE
jgi:hypothetical protein